MVKILIAVGQALYAISTLYQSQGDQIQQYGYAAFGLTVAPYAVMSIINLLGHLMAAEYPALCVVNSPVLEEARKREKCRIDGVVGSLITIGRDDWVSSADASLTWSYDPLVFCDKDSDHIEVEIPTSASKVRSDPQSVGILADAKSSLSAVSRPASTVFSIPRIASNDIDLDAEPQPVILVPASSPFKLTRENPLGYRFTGAKAMDNDSPPSWTLQENNSTLDWHFKRNLYTFICALFVSACILAIVGGISHFQLGQIATNAQRTWTMMWLSTGTLWGALVNPFPGRVDFGKLYSQAAKEIQNIKSTKKVPARRLLTGVVTFVWLSLICSPAIGGFVVVGQMYVAYGSCVQIS